jgi:hypothetical protein
MCARSNRQLVYIPEASALEMHWVSESGHLRSRWLVTSQPNQFEPAPIAPRLKAISRGTASVKTETSWLVGMLCWLVAFVL